MKHKVLSFILCLCIVTACFTAFVPTAQAAYTDGDWKWQAVTSFTATGGWCAEILDYLGDDTHVTIPETLGGYEVETIGYNAFAGCGTVKSVTIHDGVRELGKKAFSGCKNLETVTIEGGVTIGSYCFANCTSLKNFTFPTAVTVESYTFQNCTSLESIDLPDGVYYIREGAFQGCSSLKSFRIPKRLQLVERFAFDGCTSLEAFQISPENTYFSVDKNGILYNRPGNTLIRVPGGLEGDVVISDTVSTVEQCAFRSCSKVTSVTIPESVTTFHAWQFGDCTALSRIFVNGSIDISSSHLENATVCVSYADGREISYENGSRAWLWTTSGNTKTYKAYSGNNPTLVVYDGLTSLSSEPTYIIINQPEDHTAVFQFSLIPSNYGAVAMKVNEDGSFTLINEAISGDSVTLSVTGSTEFVILDNSADFPDVPEGFWAKDAIDYTSARGILTGKLNNTFGPTEAITRKTVAMVLWRIAGSPTVEADTTLSDVNLDDRYTQAICWAEDSGIINGYTDGTFRGDDELSRQHFAAMLYRFANYMGYESDPKNDTSISQFYDYNDIYNWAKPSVQWAVSNGFINGRSGNIMDPQGNTSRAQLAVILFRFLQSYWQ